MDRRFLALVLLIATCLGARQAGAAASVSIVKIRVGFDGHYRVGFWTPVEVTLQGGTDSVVGRLSLSLPDGDGVRCEVVADPIEVAAGGETRVMAYVKFGNRRSELSLRMHDGERTLAQRTVAAGGGADGVEFHEAYASTQFIVLTLGESIGVEEAMGRSRDAAERAHVLNLTDAGQLPDEWLGYEGVDLLVIGPAPHGLRDALGDGSRRLAALDRWLTEGGRLALALGADSPSHLSDEGPLARFLPGRLEEMTTLTRTTALEMYGGTLGGAPLRWRRGDRRSLAVARLADVSGRVELAEGDFPLVVRRPYTFGEVTFLAIDFSQPPLESWAGRNRSLKRLLVQDASIDSQEDKRAPPAATHLGLVDLSGQLRGALDQFGGVRLAPFWAVAALAALYIALIGPVDFLLLKTVVRKMEWTWATFPIIVLVFSGGAGWAAYRLKGDRLLVNQVDLVDFDLASGRVRGTTWFNLFSPETTTYDLSLALRVPNERAGQEPEMALSWQGLPGNVLGGTEQAVSPPSAVSRSYQFAPDRAALRQAPIAVWSTKSFVCRWSSEAEPAIETDLKLGRDDVVEGAIVNRLAGPLKDCLLVAGRWAWKFDEMTPGAAVPVRAGEQRDLQALLKDFKLVRERGQDTIVQISTPYDAASFNVRSILQQMMFYGAANGRGYTGLLNRYQPYVDLSNHLDFDQAILWGRAGRPAAAVCRDGQPLNEPGGKDNADDERDAFFRFIIPLKRSERAARH